MTTRPLLCLLAMTISLLGAGGCAVTPPKAERMAMPPPGTVITFHRKSSGSLGTYDGQVVWTHAATTWQGQPAVAQSSNQGIVLYTANAEMLASLDPSGKPLTSFDPPVDYQWPLEVGKSWRSNHTVTLHASGRTVTMTFDWKVESWGDVTVPAGTYKVYKLVWTNNLGEVETRWVSPSANLPVIKRHVERPASHPQGPGVLDAELLSIVPAAK